MENSLHSHYFLWPRRDALWLFSQAGTSVKGAYDMLVSMSVITYFIPYLFLFLLLRQPTARGKYQPLHTRRKQRFP